MTNTQVEMLIPGLSWAAVPATMPRSASCAIVTKTDTCVYDNVAVANRVKQEQRYVIACEFCDRRGPVPVLQDPVCPRADDLAMGLLSVSFPEDNVLVSCDSTSGEFTVSVYGSLIDPASRGFVRSFCIVMADTKLLLQSGYSAVQKAICLVQGKKRNLKERNVKYFNTISKPSRAGQSLRRTSTYSERRSLSLHRMPRRNSLPINSQGKRSTSLTNAQVPWKFGELTGTNAHMDFTPDVDPNLERVQGLAAVCAKFPKFVTHMLYACLRGLPIVVMGARPTGPVFDLIKQLIEQPAVEVDTNLVTLSHIRSCKLMYVPKSEDVRLDKLIWPYCCVYFANEGMLQGPKYKGRLRRVVEVSSKLPDRSCAAYVLGHVIDLMQLSCIMHRLPRLPSDVSRDDFDIITYQMNSGVTVVGSYTTSAVKVEAPVIHSP